MLTVSALAPYARNARTHSEAQIAQIADSIREFGFTNPVLIDKDNGIIAGHGRVMAAEALGMAEVPCIRLGHLSEAQKRAYILADNKIALNAGWDEKTLALEFADLQEMGFNLDLAGFDKFEIDNLLLSEGKEEREKKKTVEQTDTFEVEEEDLEKLREVQRVFFAFSGGRDSSLSYFLMAPIFKEMGKEPELLYVDTGVEIPSISEYVVRFAEHFQTNLTILRPDKDFFQHFEKKKSFPSPVFRSCIHEFINAPLDKHTFGFGESFVLIRGGRAKQTVRKAKTTKSYQLEVGKGQMLWMLNPLYDLSEEAYGGHLAVLEQEFGLWEGYAAGFARTACWCCPFGCTQQYQALKKNMPFLWQVLKRKALEWKTFGKGLSKKKEIGPFWQAVREDEIGL